MGSDTLKNEIDLLLKKYESEYKVPSHKVPLSSPTYNSDEILEAIEVLVSSRVTMGTKVLQFEKLFSEFIGSKHAIMVNSGSSANLLAVSALMSPLYKKRLKPQDEVIVPAVTWPTTIYPFAQLGITPVIVDAEINTFNIDPAAIEKAISPKTKAICIVPVLGNPCDMKSIKNICDKYNLLLIEDTCESLGSSYMGKMCGTFGEVGTYSFFFSHHMTTIEGGMVVTDNDDLADILRSQRAHGWIRNHSKKSELENKYSYLDSRFLFIDMGFNLRPMELQAAFGIHQLRKLPAMNESRRNLASIISNGLSKHKSWIHLPSETPQGKHTWFGFPFLIKNVELRRPFMNFLESNGIETRPVIGGDLTKQPAFETFQWRKGSDLITAQEIHKKGIYFGTHPGMNESHCLHIINVFERFANEQGLI